MPRATSTAPGARIHLVRHGSTRLNAERRYQGSADEPLDAVGVAQAEAIATALADADVTEVISSGAGRALETASAIAGAGADLPVAVDPRWAEARHGHWEGLTYDEVAARWPDEAAARYADPVDGRSEGGESLAEVASRVLEAWRELVARAEGDVVVVTHATPIRVVVATIRGAPLATAWQVPVALGSVTTVVVDGITRLVAEGPAATRPARVPEDALP